MRQRYGKPGFLGGTNWAAVVLVLQLKWSGFGLNPIRFIKKWSLFRVKPFKWRSNVAVFR
jgi:hypothetical protein